MKLETDILSPSVLAGFWWTLAGRPLPTFFLLFPIFSKSSYLFLFLLRNSYFFLFLGANSYFLGLNIPIFLFFLRLCRGGRPALVMSLLLTF